MPFTYSILPGHSAVVYGSQLLGVGLRDLSLSDSAGNATGDTFSFASITVIAMNSNNVIYGNLRDLTLSATNAGFTIIGSNGGAGNVFSFLGNIITVGNGQNVVYGNLHDLSLKATGDNLIGGNGTEGNHFEFARNLITIGDGKSVV